MYGNVDCVKALLSTPGIDVNIQNSDGDIPLKIATKYEVITILQKYTTSCEDYPIHSFGKVILCGDTGSGKSTLAQVIYMFECFNSWRGGGGGGVEIFRAFISTQIYHAESFLSIPATCMS